MAEEGAAVDTRGEGLRVARNSAFLSGGAVVGLGLGFVSTILVTDTLGEDYGLLIGAQRFVGFFLVIASFGLHPLLVRRLAARRDEPGELFGTVIFLRALLGAFFAFLVPTVAAVAGYLPDARWVLLGFVAIEFLGVFADSYVALCEGYERMARVALVPLVRSLTTFVGVVAVTLSGAGLAAILGVYLLGQLVRLGFAAALAHGALPRMQVRLRRDRVRPLLSEAGWFVAVGLSSSALASLAVVGLARLAGPGETARYGAALNFVDLVVMAPLLVQRALLPAFSRLQASGGAAGLANGGLRIVPALLIPAGAGLAVLADPVLALYPSGQFGEAAPVLRVLALGLLFLGPSYVSGTYLTGSGRLRTLFVVNVVAAGVEALLLLALVPSLGAPGAAWAAVTAFAAASGIQLLAIRGEGVEIPWAPLLRVGLASAGMAALVYPFRELPLPVAVAVGVVGYAALLWLLTPRDSLERRLLEQGVAPWRSR